ncbi:MAG: hypothetical protein OZ921_07635 [Sorangiineae bacterium]|nr:hypothetical protein [Polyangiaceae bacterium]MEB2322368.1 hypothetical protein [Sorangiineae bacterium]
MIEGGGINLARVGRLEISRNRMRGYRFISEQLSCLELTGNEVEYEGLFPYLFEDTRGRASGNRLNGAPVDFPLSPDVPFGNH